MDRPHPCSLQGAQPYLASWKRKGAELGQRRGALPQEAGEARKWGLSHQLLSQGKRGSSQAEAEPRHADGTWEPMKWLAAGAGALAGRQPAQAGSFPFIIRSKAFTVNKRAN